jgi:hypothetical protein
MLARPAALAIDAGQSFWISRAAPIVGQIDLGQNILAALAIN